MGWHERCDMGATKLAMVTSGEASHSPQPTSPPALTRARMTSWLLSEMSSTSGMRR